MHRFSDVINSIQVCITWIASTHSSKYSVYHMDCILLLEQLQSVSHGLHPPTRAITVCITWIASSNSSNYSLYHMDCILPLEQLQCVSHGLHPPTRVITVCITWIASSNSSNPMQSVSLNFTHLLEPTHARSDHQNESIASNSCCMCL